MGRVRAICISPKKGTVKRPIQEGTLVKDFGLLEDAHGGNWHRQVSLLAYSKVEAFNEQGGNVVDGDFGENLLIEDIDLRGLPVGTHLKIGDAILEITQIGKECHQHCQIYHRVGDCIMPREGIFAKVLEGGKIYPDQEVEIISLGKSRYHAAVITASDKGSRGERVDTSGPIIQKFLEDMGIEVVEMCLLADDQKGLENAMKRLVDSRQVDLIITTGGTGLSPRDQMPEATLAIADRLVPGIAESIRYYSLQITKRAMLSRGVSVIRKNTLIVNLPGSPKAVSECLEWIGEQLEHGLDILTQNASECART